MTTLPSSAPPASSAPTTPPRIALYVLVPRDAAKATALTAKLEAFARTLGPCGSRGVWGGGHRCVFSTARCTCGQTLAIFLISSAVWPGSWHDKMPRERPISSARATKRAP